MRIELLTEKEETLGQKLRTGGCVRFIGSERNYDQVMATKIIVKDYCF